MEKASGVVEAIGLRVTQLRDDDGTVWYVRNGEVLRVGQLQPGRRRPTHRDRRAPTPARELRYSPKDASRVMVVPVRAWETGQFSLASSAAASNCSRRRCPGRHP